MATYASLSPEDKAVLQNGMNLIRAAAGEICRHFNHQIALSKDANLQAILASVDNTEVIPNTSGLGGADDMTKQELSNLYTYIANMRVIVGTYPTGRGESPEFRAAASKAAGVNAMLG